MTPPIPKRRFHRRRRPRAVANPDGAPATTTTSVGGGLRGRRRRQLGGGEQDRLTNEDRVYEPESNEDMSVSVEEGDETSVEEFVVTQGGGGAGETDQAQQDEDETGGSEEEVKEEKAIEEDEGVLSNTMTTTPSPSTNPPLSTSAPPLSTTTPLPSTAGVAEFNDDGNPSLISCAPAISAAAAAAVAAAGDDEAKAEAARRDVHALKVTFDYQLYYDETALASLRPALAEVEGAFFRSLAEEAGLPADGASELECADFLELGDGDDGAGRLRFQRRSLRSRRVSAFSDLESARIVGLDDRSGSERDGHDEDHNECLPLDSDDGGSACAPISGSVLVEMVGANEAGVDSHVKAFARTWMEEPANYRDSITGVDRLAFLGARAADADVGKSGVVESVPSTGDSAVASVIKTLTGGDGDVSEMGIAFAFFLCLGLALIVTLGTWRVVRSRRERKRLLVEERGGSMRLDEEVPREKSLVEEAEAGAKRLNGGDNFSDETEESGEERLQQLHGARAPEENFNDDKSSESDSASSSPSSVSEETPSQPSMPPIFCRVQSSTSALGHAESKDEIEIVLPPEQDMDLAACCSSVTMGDETGYDDHERRVESPRFEVICDEASSTGTAYRSEA